MQMIIGIILGILIPAAAVAGFMTGIWFTTKKDAERFVKFKAEVRKMILEETHSLDTEADKEYVWSLIDKIEYWS